MQKKARLYLLLCLPAWLFALFAPAAAPAAQDMFLELNGNGLQGESSDKEYKDQIDVLAFSWGLSNGGPPILDKKGVQTGGGVSFQNLHVTKYVDRSSPQLFLRTANGNAISNAVLSVRKAGDLQATSFKLCMSDVRVTSMQNGATTGEDRMTESFTLSYGTVGMLYRRQNANGSLQAPITAGWDVLKGLETGVMGCQ
jgi:type VI secretion system secreted protein Hcp